MDVFKLLTPITYWLLIILWSYILFFYVKRLLSKDFQSKLTILLMIILTIEAFRTLFESVYFGLWYTALSGILPKSVYLFLVRPEMVIIPKSINVFAALIIIILLIRKWMPHEGREIEQLDSVVKMRTKELENLTKTLEIKVKERTYELEKSNKELKAALLQVRTLSGFLPICANCKKIRNDKGYWEQVESYIEDNSEAEFSHSICPECAELLYGYKKS